MLPRQISFANVIALVALFIALGSGVYAAQQEPEPDGAAAGEEAIVGDDATPGGDQDGTGGAPGGSASGGREPDPAELGLPKATGRVHPDGTLDAGARGMRSSKVRRAREGTYCISINAGVPLITGGLAEEDQAEADVLLMDDAQARETLGHSLAELGCPAPRRWLVQTRNSRGVADDSWFYVALFD